MLKTTVKKTALIVGVLALFGVIGLSGCTKETEAIKIGATEVPHAQILEFAQPLLEEEGVEIEIIVFSDYVSRTCSLLINNWTPTSSNIFPTLRIWLKNAILTLHGWPKFTLSLLAYIQKR